MIRGPLGIWTFPILNFLLSLLTSKNEKPATNITTNKEEWELQRDERGRLRNVIVYRYVREKEGTS